MSLAFIRRTDIPALWPIVSQVLAKAIEISSLTEAEVFEGLLTGEMTLWRVENGASGYVVTTMGPAKHTGRLGCWVLYAAGKVMGGPKHRLATYKWLLQQIATKASDMGCRDLWVEARHSWKRAMTGFEVVRVLPTRTEWKKRL